MKKRFSRATVCALTVLAVTTAQYLPVMAADDSKDTTVKYKVAESYTWEVTSDITFENDASNADSTKEGEVKVNSSVIDYKKELKITVKGNETDGSFKITNTGDQETKLDYTVKKDNVEITSGGVALEVKAGTGTPVTQKLSFVLSAEEKKKAVYSGEYKGTATFTAAVVDAAN